MNKIKKILISIVLICCMMSFLVPINEVLANDKKGYVLYISSYSYSWETTPQQIKGVQKALSNTCVINYEFMDTKNVSYDNDYKQYYDILKYKLSQRPVYDGVIVGDDAALQFVQLYKDELFPNTPIAFTGIDNIDNAKMAAKDPLISGVIEQVDYKKNVEVASKLRPQAKKIIFINDRKENGIGIQNQLENSKKFMNHYKVSYLISSDYTKEELESKLHQIGNDTIIFMISLGQGKNNVIYTEDERMDIITNNISVPIFRVSSTNFNNAFIGGYVVDHEKCAYLASTMIRHTLDGKKMANEQFIENTPSIYCFNQKIMDRYDISKSLLPKGTIIKNPDPTFLEKNYIMITNIFVILTMILLIVIIVIIRRNLTISKKSNKKIDEQYKELEKALHAKEDFLSRMSHEMRTPLNSILGCTHLATLNCNHQKDITEDLFMINRSGEYLLNLINDILDVSRIEANKIQLNNDWCSPREVVQSIEFMMTPIMEEKNIHFEFPQYDNSGIEKIEWFVDSKRIQQTAINLLNNAAKFTPKGGTVKFEIENIFFDDKMAVDRVSVIDTGCGMTKEFISHIGEEAFIQEQNQYSSQTIGSGLGLYIVKSIVKLMGGELHVESELGKGSTFSFEIKYKYRLKKNDDSQHQVEKGDVDLSGIKVLYADDNSMNQIVAKKLLESKDVEVVLASNGKEAVDIINQSKKGEYQAILMDMRMPVMGGLEATQEIRKLDHPNAKIPIIALSADAIASEIKAAIDKGLTDYLTKPIRPNQLYQTLEKYCKK